LTVQPASTSGVELEFGRVLIGCHDDSDLVFCFLIQHLEVVNHLCPFLQLVELIKGDRDVPFLVQLFPDPGEKFVDWLPFPRCRISEFDQELSEEG
jgi:hypothetical protein